MGIGTCTLWNKNIFQQPAPMQQQHAMNNLRSKFRCNHISVHYREKTFMQQTLAVI